MSCAVGRLCVVPDPCQYCATVHRVVLMTSAYEQGSVPPIEVRHRLRIAREWAGLDQDQLAERSGVSRAAVSNAENGKGVPRRATINALALALGVPAGWIRTGELPDGGPGGPGTNGAAPDAGNFGLKVRSSTD